MPALVARDGWAQDFSHAATLIYSFLALHGHLMMRPRAVTTSLHCPVTWPSRGLQGAQLLCLGYPRPDSFSPPLSLPSIMIDPDQSHPSGSIPRGSLSGLAVLSTDR